MQNQLKDVFPSDTKKNPKDCMAMTLRSGKKEKEKGKTEKEKKEETGKETKQGSSELVEEIEKEEAWTE